MHNKQGWKEQMPDGDEREVRVIRNGRNWRFQSRLKSVKEWTFHRPPLKEDVASLYDLLLRKHNRRRCSIRDVQVIEKLLKSYD
jgi:hypothetical protein